MVATLTAVDLVPPKPHPTPEPPPPRQTSHAAAGKSAPANIKSKASPIVAFKPVIPLPVPIPAASKPATGAQSQTGASTLPGNGSGAGGLGTGTGSGDSGDGEGDGGSPIEWTGGRIKDSDYPRDAHESHAQGTVTVEVSVATNGRPTACHISHSSGFAELDDTTCRLILQRYRFRAATDATGHAVADTVLIDHEWTLGREKLD